MRLLNRLQLQRVVVPGRPRLTETIVSGRLQLFWLVAGLIAAAATAALERRVHVEHLARSVLAAHAGHLAGAHHHLATAAEHRVQRAIDQNRHRTRWFGSLELGRLLGLLWLRLCGSECGCNIRDAGLWRRSSGGTAERWRVVDVVTVHRERCVLRLRWMLRLTLAENVLQMWLVDAVGTAFRARLRCFC